MPDIFLSYASSDRATAELLARDLAARGFSVWWDRGIAPGKEFDEVIEQALKQAACVVVLWSRQSVDRVWVQVEAAAGARRRVLVPALIDDAEIPFEFGRIQTAELVGYQGAGHPGFEQLVQAITLTVKAGSRSDFLRKLAENARLRRFTAVFAPGIILTFAFLTLLSAFTRLEVFPYARLPEYQKHVKSAHEALASLDKQADALLDSIAALSPAEQPGLERRLQRLEAQQTSERQSLAELRQQENDARTLTGNLEALSKHFIALFIVGFVASVVMAQVSVALLYNGSLYRYFKRRFLDVNEALYSTADAEKVEVLRRRLRHRTATYFQLKTGVGTTDFLERYLQDRYYRPLEAAMNMILPVGFLALALAAGVVAAYPFSAKLWLVMFSLSCLVAAILLYRDARDRFIVYHLKAADLLTVIQEQTGLSTKLPQRR